MVKGFFHVRGVLSSISTAKETKQSKSSSCSSEDVERGLVSEMSKHCLLRIPPFFSYHVLLASSNLKEALSYRSVNRQTK